ncbi:hypothetical protein CHU94_00135 [Rhodoferax sp. TH121]|uniref:FG-GAP-like repeat-containing protein n=1 Tax=Rhodoferax sp. TH121 TaxID=2022803 RepID=UPI000B96EE63|nr:FG-GAP-like repeat-containing protein [Rhodoferax sp. TH121]OYQ43400.1 hypothetical protein CHU94_00135 [Rhodoferax sp. TH121]
MNNRSGFASPSYWLSGQFGTSQGWSDNNTLPRQLVDVNGDGLPDVVGFNATGVQVALNTGSGFSAPTAWLNAQFGTSQGWTDNNVMPRQLVDVNGDGRPDIVGFNASGVQVALNTGSGFAAPTTWIQNQFGKDQGWTNNTDNPRQLVDINNDGLPDIVGFAGNGVSVALNTGSGFETASSTPANYSCSGGRTLIGSACGVPANPVMGCPANMFTSQYDGGDIDCAYVLAGNAPHYPPIVVGYSCTSAMGSLQGSSCTIPANYSCPTGYTASGSNCTLNAAGGTASAGWSLAQFGVAQGWTDSKLHPRQIVDINGDGLPDIVGFGPSGVMVSINTGSTFQTPSNWISNFGVSAGAWTDSNTQPRQIADVNGDGLPDVVGFGPNGVMVALNKGDGFATPTNWIANFGTAAGGWSDNNSAPRFLADANGDGMLDIVGFSSSGVVVAVDNRKATAHYLSSLTTGTGEVTTASYAALTAAGVYAADTASNKAVFPQVDLAFPIHVLSQVERTNGTGTTNKTSYTYGGLKAELASGRGMLGFRWVKSKNLETQLENYVEYRQDYPYTGATSLQEVRLSGAGNNGVLKRTSTTYQCTNPQTASACSVAAGNRYFVFPASTTEQSWDISGAANPGNTLQQTYAVNPNGQFYGDLTRTQLTTTDGNSKTSDNEYYAADTSNWILGRIKNNTLTGVSAGNTKVQTKAFEYTAQGLQSKETLEPGSPNDCLQTSFAYDAFGNRSQATAAACAAASGTAVLSAAAPRTSADNYGSEGRFPLVSTNALNQSENKLYDARFGGLTSLTGPNGLNTTWVYDSFGRKTRENRADGTYTTWAYQLCSEAGSNCPAQVGNAVVASVSLEQSYAVNATASAPPKRQFYDILNRVVRVQSLGFDGGGAAATVYQDTEYTAQGQVAKQSDIYASTATPVWTSYAYDAMGRLQSQSQPDSAAAGGIATTSYSYNGPSTTITNAKGQTKTTVKNSLGQVVSVTDAQGNAISYAYDGMGNLAQTNASGSITTLQYNLRGNKIAMQDPAMGSWVYGYNVFGELVTQRDSLNQTTTMAYDVLGRMVKRTEPDLVSDWSFDTKFDGSSCGKGVGKLCEAKADNNYKRTHAYDSLGRPSSTATVLDNPASPAVVSETFDPNTGRVSSKTWPTGYQASYSYSTLGYLTAVNGGGTNGFSQTTRYQILAMNAQGQITQYKTGNNVTTVKTFDPQTQRLSGLLVTRDGQSSGNVLNHAYTYDQIGNLLTRVDSTQGVGTQESFSYDSLNRLTTASILGGAVSPPTTTEVLYDTRGNITYKSDVGRYWYDAVRPNRMTQVTLETAPGATVPLSGTRTLSYAFDDYSAGALSVNGTTVGNGNLAYTVSQDTVNNKHTVRFESYTSFNMPAQITYGNFTANTVTCPPGYTLANGLCNQSTNTAIPAQKVYSCPAGQVLNGTSCTLTTTNPATPNYSCPAGYTVSGSNCVNVSTTGATAVYGCPSGYWYSEGLPCTSGSGRPVLEVVIGYSCPSGYLLSSSSCTRTTTIAATLANYFCASGWVLNGSTCSLTTSSDASAVSATPIYACANGATLSGDKCFTTISTSSTPVMGCASGTYSITYDNGTGCSNGLRDVGLSIVGYSCPTGYSLSGSTCYRTINSSASIASYSCPAGRTLVGTGCVTAGATFAGYACDVGTLNGNNCIVAKTSTVTPGSSNASDRTLTFVYGPEHQRIKQNVALSGNGTSAYFSGNTWYLNGEDSLGLTYEKEVRSNGTTEHKHYVNAAGFTFALFTSRTGTLNGLPAATTSYFHKDQLGSVSTITDETGAVTERLAYDPWGKRRFISSTPGMPDTLDAITGIKTDRGYTEHEHLDEVGVIHMNGRVYDPLMGRFMSADPIVQSPYNLKSFNRYSYVWNNPMRMFDPTGFKAYESSSEASGEGSSSNSFDSPSFSWSSFFRNLFSGWGDSAPSSPDSPDRRSSSGGTQVAVLPLPYIAGGGGAGAALGGAAAGVVCDCPYGNRWGIDPVTGDPVSESRTNKIERIKRDLARAAEATKTGVEGGLKKVAPLLWGGLSVMLSESDADNVDDTKPPLSDYKDALGKVHDKVGKLPKGEDGKFGSPQAGDSKKGYRLDPPHDGKAEGDAESKYHFNWWDYTNGKRGKGGNSGAIPIGK